ncbi:MAG TPA: hypothetical protein P5161_00480 [Eubacteriales bacterium]|nr:hypothetical protein [Clostridia bacterium]HRR89244.1 hypothetical protein [Eubacteriales bacterium]HRU84682.1 hypothetical protein [Eubacteriales bacterium]
MLEIKLEKDAEMLEKAYRKFGLSCPPRGISVLLFSDGEIAGAARLSFDGETAFLEEIKPEGESGEADFFLRAILYKLSLTDATVAIRRFDERFFKFGFKKEGGGMHARGNEIVFPSVCGG